MLIVSICKEFGWTFYDYYNQPQYFLNLILEKMKIDEQKYKNELKNLNKKN